MRHKKDRRKLKRRSEERIALMRALSRALIMHGRIRTTVQKAKEARRYVERLVTLARKAAAAEETKDAIALRRRALAMLPDKPMIRKLFNVVAPLFADRNGGYTRIVRLPTRRLGDGAEEAFLEFVVPIPRTDEYGEVIS